LQAAIMLSYFFLTFDRSATMASPAKLRTTLSTKGQVILPKAIREHRHWMAGTRLVVEDTADGVLLKEAPAFAPSRMEDVFASLPYAGAPKTLEEMDAAIAAEVRRRHARNRY
jgi:AbrB family looped-hinge helix DNA binding protein